MGGCSVAVRPGRRRRYAAFNVQVHALSSKPGRVVKDQQRDRVNQEPVFEDQPIYEVRIRYAAYMGLRWDLLNKPQEKR